MVVGVEMREERERERKRDKGAIAVARSLVGSASREWNSTLCFSFPPFVSALSRSPRLLIAESDLEAERGGGESEGGGERETERKTRKLEEDIQPSSRCINDEGRKRRKKAARTAEDERRRRADEPEEGRDRVSGPRCDHD